MFRELGGEHFQFRLGLRDGHAGPQPPDHVDVMPAASITCGFIRLERHRHPDIDFARQAKADRSDADDGVRFAVELNGAPDRVASAAKDALPEWIAQHDHVVLSRRVLFREQHAAEDRLHAVDIEVMRGRLHPDEPLRFAFAGEIHARAGVGGEIFVRLRLFFPIEIVRRRDGEFRELRQIAFPG